MKADLFTRAVVGGRELPFGAPHASFEAFSDILKVPGRETLSHYAYRRMLCQVVNDLPVQIEFDADIEKFDIEKLEWLPILLYMGMISLKMRNTIPDSDDTSSMSYSSDTMTIVTVSVPKRLD